jgi:serine/threonine-protein kinase
MPEPPLHPTADYSPRGPSQDALDTTPPGGAAEAAQKTTGPPAANPAAASPPDEAQGTQTADQAPRIAGYEVLAPLGEGGMGIVYKARHTALRRVVALKKIRSGDLADLDEQRRFQAEAEAVAQLQHPNVVQVFEVGQHGGAPYFALEYCAGGSLERQLDGTPWEARRAAALVEVLARAMQAVHAVGIIHRDLKPANVLLTADGTPKVTDFGLVKRLDVPGHTQRNAVVGTPSYMPPEQAGAWGGAIGPASDVYALGAILYELLTGRPPFKAATTLETVLQVLSDEPVPVRRSQPKVPRDLETICHKCLEKDPKKRYPTSAALAEDLRRFLAGEPVRARPVGPVRRLGKWARRRPALATLVLAAVAGVAAVLLVQYRANVQLAAKNAELAERQAEAEARFELTLKAIATFHTGVSEDALLRNREFTELRTRLLREAAAFYAELEQHLQGKTDPKSRRLLAAGFFQLGELTERIGDNRQALAVQRKALAVRRELAAMDDDVPARLDVARSLGAVGRLLRATGDTAGARATFEEQRSLAGALEGESPTDAVRAELARAYNGTGLVLKDLGKPDDALTALGQARALRQELADAHPDVAAFQSDLAHSLHDLGLVLQEKGKAGEALAAYQQARDIRQKLAKSDRDVLAYQRDLAVSHNNVGSVLSRMGNLTGALAAWQQAQTIRQQLAADYPAVSAFQSDLANSHFNVGWLYSETGKPADALEEWQQALSIRQRLADANPAVMELQRKLADSHFDLGVVLIEMGRPADALTHYRKALAINQKLSDAHPDVPDLQHELAQCHNNAGILLAQLGHADEALQAHRRALVLRQQLADAHPSLPGYQEELSRSQNNIALLLSQAGHLDESMAAHEKARGIRQKLADAHPGVPDYACNLARTHNHVAMLLLKMGKPAEAMASCQKGLTLQRQLTAAQPKLTTYQIDLARSLTSQGILQRRAGRVGDAVASWREALALLDRLPAPTPDNHYSMALCHALLAAVAADSGAGMTAGEGRAAAERAMESLRRAVAAGYADATSMGADPELDALRSRPDFQQLLDRLKKKAAARDTGLTP